MADQQTASLFVDDVYTAIGDLIRALGGLKKVGVALKPDKPADEAGRWLSDCLNREKRDKLDLDQLMWLLKEGRKVGCHVAANFMLTEAGYAAPIPIEPLDEMAELQRQFMESVRTQARLVDRIEKIQPRLTKAA